MGCDQSTASGGDAEKAREFRRYCSNGNSLAKAMKKHWEEFLKENDHMRDGNKSAAERMKRERAAEVKVNRDVAQARKENLTFDTSRDVANSFLGFAMESIADRNWGGSVRYNIRGAAGRESNIAVTGSVTYSANDGMKYTIPYSVEMIFFLC